MHIKFYFQTGFLTEPKDKLHENRKRLVNYRTQIGERDYIHKNTCLLKYIQLLHHVNNICIVDIFASERLDSHNKQMAEITDKRNAQNVE